MELREGRRNLVPTSAKPSPIMLRSLTRVVGYTTNFKFSYKNLLLVEWHKSNYALPNNFTPLFFSMFIVSSFDYSATESQQTKVA